VEGRRGRALTWYVTASEGVKRLTLFYEGTTVNAELDSCRDWQARLSPAPMSQHVWQPWETLVFFIALAILGVCWTIWTLDILRSIAQRYSLGAALGLNSIFGRPGPEVPPLVLITTVSLIVGVAGFVAAVIVIALFAARALGVNVAGSDRSPAINSALIFRTHISHRKNTASEIPCSA
jgi:hypothetical protein